MIIDDPVGHLMAVACHVPLGEPIALHPDEAKLFTRDQQDTLAVDPYLMGRRVVITSLWTPL